jgi:hypothetical protein
MFSSQNFTPFRSGCGMCKPSTDYYKTQTAGGNYSNDGLIPASNGKNFYKAQNFNMPLDSTFIKNNKGIDYATSFGGKKTIKKSSIKAIKSVVKKVITKKPSAKKVITKKLSKKIKGGNYSEYASVNYVDSENHNGKMKLKLNLSGGEYAPVHEEQGEGIKGDLITSNYSPLKGGKKNSKKMKGGVVQEEHSMDVSNALKMLTKSGGKKMNGGQYAPVHEEQGDGIKGDLITSNYSPLKGGKKNSKKMKGGVVQEEHSMDVSNALKMLTKSGGKKMNGGQYAPVHEEQGEGIKGDLITSNYSPLKGGKKNSKKMKGGVVQEEHSPSISNALKMLTKSGGKKMNGGNNIVQEEHSPSISNALKMLTKSGGKKMNGDNNIVQEEHSQSISNALKMLTKSGGKKMNGGNNIVQEEHSPSISNALKMLTKSGGNKDSIYGETVENTGIKGFEGNLTSKGAPLSGGKKKMKQIKKQSKPVKKPTKKMMKGGMESSGATPMPLRFYNSKAPLDNYPATSENGIMSAYGAIKSGDVGTGMLAPYTSSTCSYANTNTNMKTGGTKSRKQKGGMESSGATPMPLRFYNSNAPLDNYPATSGNGIMSAYGAIKSGDVGTGMLAPYTSSKCSYANANTNMKTGGKKSRKQHGNGRIPEISDGVVTSVQGGINGAIDGFSQFMDKLNEGYLKSVESAKSVKIGNQRLIKGGKKIEPKKKAIKKPSKKVIQKKPSKKQVKKGGNGSDYALTQNSRGPVNAPDDYWGVPGEQWFRQFNKSGDYIPNSQLPYAATPTLAGTEKNNYVIGYNEMELAGKY